MPSFFSQGKKIELEEVVSTNNYMANYLSELTEGSIVVAKYQTIGRGLGVNTWESESGKNLTFSILLRPLFLKVYDQFYLSKAVSLAVADFVSLYADNVSVKWPNDIYIGHKKVAGILIENTVERDIIQSAIVGIGLNVNQQLFESDAPNPISLFQNTGEVYDLEELLDILVDLIEFRYQMLSELDFESIDDLYFEILYKRNKLSKFKAGNEIFNGIIHAVRPTGELIICDESGKEREFLYKEVEYLF